MNFPLILKLAKIASIFKHRLLTLRRRGWKKGWARKQVVFIRISRRNCCPFPCDYLGAHASTSRRQVVHTHNGGSTHAFSLHTHERRCARTASSAFFHAGRSRFVSDRYASTREKRFLDRINIEITARGTRHTVAATPVASRDTYLRVYRPRESKGRTENPGGGGRPRWNWRDPSIGKSEAWKIRRMHLESWG